MVPISEQNKLMKTLWDLILLAKRVGKALDQAKSSKVDCREMGKQVYQLSQLLNTLLCFSTLSPTLLTYLNPMYCVITEVSNILQKVLTLACTCKSETIFCRFLIGTKATHFHKLYHLLDVCIPNMKWLLILYNPDFGSAFDEIFLSLPRILSNDSSTLSAWSCMVTDKKIWEIATMLTSETSPLELKICCAEALSLLNVGSALINSRMIKEAEGLMLCLANLVEAEHGHELQCHCLMTIMEITAAAESDLDLRCKAFKTYSPGTNAIVEQLLRVIKDSEDPKLQVLAIKSIGSLARIFNIARGNHLVISVLVSQIGNEHQEVATEAVVALQNFVCPGNFLHKAHSKTVIEFNAVQPLVKLLRDGEGRQQPHGLLLMCYHAVNADYSEAMEEARVRTAVEQLTRKRRGRTVALQHPELKEMVPKALRSLHCTMKTEERE